MVATFSDMLDTGSDDGKNVARDDSYELSAAMFDKDAAVATSLAVAIADDGSEVVNAAIAAATGPTIRACRVDTSHSSLPA